MVLNMVPEIVWTLFPFRYHHIPKSVPLHNIARIEACAMELP